MLRCADGLLLWLDHRFAVGGGTLPGSLNGFLGRDPVMKHFRVGTPDALREVKITTIFDGGATDQRNGKEHQKTCSGLG